MSLKELVRQFSTHRTHRTMYCYMILSIWIFLLIAGMYKYIGQTSSYLTGNTAASSSIVFDLEGTADEETLKLRKFHQRCTPIDQINRHEDGGILEGWKLQGVLLVIRHGDRGPMSHVRMTQVDCGVVANSLVNRYRSFLQNTSSASGANHLYWNKVGPFHGFALLPAAEKSCLLGQLTYKGIAQLLQVGEMLHQIYAHQLNLLIRQPQHKSSSSSTPHSLLNSDEIVLFTTRYRRTFQSALALLFALLPTDKWMSLNVLESHSMAFCFTDCACPQAEKIRKHIGMMTAHNLQRQPIVSDIMKFIGSTLLQHTPNGINDPNEVIDAVLAVLCHNAPLPCRRATNISTRMPTAVSQFELNDVINIDQEDDAAANLLTASAGDNLDLNDESQTATAEGCIEPAHISTLMGYTISAQEAIYYKRIGLLRAYGLIRHIVSYMLKMISGDRTKFVLYSGHDWTLQFLTAALGIRTEGTFIPYAARLAIEVYKSEALTDYYFRVVYNGRDVTQQIDFCEGGKSLRITRDSRGNKADLCPIENIIRFLHEDYFLSLNATNFKDACTVSQQKGNEF